MSIYDDTSWTADAGQDALPRHTDSNCTAVPEPSSFLVITKSIDIVLVLIVNDPIFVTYRNLLSIIYVNVLFSIYV